MTTILAADAAVPTTLRGLFILHFWADIAFALPLFFAPEALLTLGGWTAIDPISARLVAAALFGIGIESWLGRDADVSSYRAMLNLKVIWSATATVGIAWSLLEGAHGRPPFAWLALGIFALFHVIWVYWRWRLHKAR